MINFPNAGCLRSRPAFTLIELILALALSGVLLALLGAALHLGISRAMGSRQNVEQARLVEGVLTLLVGDIEGAVIYNPQDTSTAMSMAEEIAKFDVDSIDDISAAGSGGGAAAGSGGGSGSSAAGADDAAATAVSLRRPLGVYGTLSELQIDVFREHPKYEIDAEGNLTPPTTTSGVTTVRYAIGEGVASLGATAALDGRSGGTGLVRQEVSRDLLNWAEQQGTAAALAGQALLIAPEVSRLQFRYFDGLEVAETWDSQLLQGKLPRAIELSIWFVQERDSTTGGEPMQVETMPYVVSVALPTSWNVEEDASAAAVSDTAEASDASSSAEGDP